MELYQFLKDNAELVAAETEITKIMNAAEAGEQVETDNSRITNLLEMIGESANDL